MAPFPFVSAPGRVARDLAVLRKVVAALPEPVIAVGADDTILDANPAARVLIPSLRAGLPLASHMRSPDVLDAVAAARAGETTARTTWLERVPVERLFEVSVSPVDALDCGPIVLLYLHEVSETRRFERMRVDFIANASHELRTPLASLLGFVETLQGPARRDDKARDRFLTIMRDLAQRMARLVDDLLSLSRIEQHLHLQPRDRVDLVALVRHITDTLIPLAQDSGVVLALENDEAVAVSGDRDELMRVAENLIENAVKHGASDAADRRVVVTVARQRAEAVLTVRDHGVGIAPEHLPRLTERFYRVDAGQSRAKGGTGLGLALVKHVVARHRGRLAIDSIRGEGSTFKVTLPLFADDVERDRA